MVDEAPTGKRHVDSHIAQIFRRNAFQIVGKNYKVREATGGDSAPVVFATAAQRSIGSIRPQSFKRAYALIWPKKNTPAAHPVDSRMHGGQGCNRQYGRINMQGKGHTQANAAPGRVEARRALRAKEYLHVPVAPDFNMAGKKAGNDAARLHALKLIVRSGLRMHDHVVQRLVAVS